MSDAANYTLPTGIVGLTGAVQKPAPGSLPLRGDLAHIALANRYLAAHYVIPMIREIGSAPTAMLTLSRDDAEVVCDLDPGTRIEVLDYAGSWCWVCLGPEGPSGYVPIDALKAEDNQ